MFEIENLRTGKSFTSKVYPLKLTVLERRIKTLKYAIDGLIGTGQDNYIELLKSRLLWYVYMYDIATRSEYEQEVDIVSFDDLVIKFNHKQKDNETNDYE